MLAGPWHGGADHAVHGLRSSFRDWAAEKTDVADAVAEACLAHAVGDKTKAAYLRTDFFRKRARLMQQWAGYCLPPPRAPTVHAPPISASSVQRPAIGVVGAARPLPVLRR